MVAFWGIPGSRQFVYARFKTMEEAESWIENKWNSCRQTQEDLQAYMQSEVHSNRSAFAMRYRDGSRVVRSGTEGLETGEETTPEIEQEIQEAEDTELNSMMEQAVLDASLEDTHWNDIAEQALDSSR